MGIDYTRFYNLIRSNMKKPEDFIKEKDAVSKLHYGRYIEQEKVINLMAEYSKCITELILNDISMRLSNSLGECVDGNDYEIIADGDGRFWISHKEVGSGEPLEQWINSVINIYANSDE